MRWIKWALLAISFLIPLAVADPQWSVVSAKPYPPVISLPTHWQLFPESIWTPSTGIATAEVWFEIELPKTVPSLTATWPLELEWQRLVPAPGGTVGSGYWQPWSVGWKPPLGAKANFKAPEWMEGNWRLRARFAGGAGWPWSQWRPFSIGDPVDYSKPSPVISQPVQGAHYEKFPSLLLLQTITLQKADGTTLVEQKDIPLWVPLEVQVRVRCPTGWDRYYVKLVQSTTLIEVASAHVDKCGKWKIRARLKSDITATTVGGTPLPQPQYPWSAWTVFYVGPAGLVLQYEDKAKLREPVKQLGPVAPYKGPVPPYKKWK